jgi:hypothetical protein
MVNKVTIELPSELALKLTNQALEQQTTLEDMIVNLLFQLNENQNGLFGQYGVKCSFSYILPQ